MISFVCTKNLRNVSTKKVHIAMTSSQPSKHLLYCGRPSGNLLVQDETVLSVQQQADFSTIVVQFVTVMCNSNSGIGTGIGIPVIFRAYGIGIRIESKAKIILGNWNRN